LFGSEELRRYEVLTDRERILGPITAIFSPARRLAQRAGLMVR
jgi:hypothetical protein